MWRYVKIIFTVLGLVADPLGGRRVEKKLLVSYNAIDYVHM